MSYATPIVGAVDVLLDDGRRIWCPPAWVASIEGGPHVIKRPYWTAGQKCKPQQAGPELTDEEIEEVL